MTAFSEQERSMMWGIYGELETMNRSLTRLVELLEHQERPQVVQLNVQEGAATDIMAAVKANRRLHGWCLLCGATRRNPGEGCYKWAPVNPYVEVWAPHSWPEETPERG